MRESAYIKGLITTTTNGFDWVYDRFVKDNKGDGTFGSMHVETQLSLHYGIITETYYNMLLSTYSPLLAAQELFAKHVNVKLGRAYYATSEKNCSNRAPWGDEYPDLSRPLIVGCDFNFAPAPCVWVYGQTGPGDWDSHIHWFGEVAMTETSTETMTHSLVSRLPDFFFRIFGDASGNRGTTSNAGETDYMQMQGVLEDFGVGFSIDADQANPFVKDRVESVNAMAMNGLGEVRMTYSPDACPYLHADLAGVGWSENGKLKGQNINQTHSSDAIGYAIFKLFGPHSAITLEPSVPSALRG
jgi:hypothetical protein